MKDLLPIFKWCVRVCVLPVLFVLWYSFVVIRQHTESPPHPTGQPGNKNTVH